MNGNRYEVRQWFLGLAALVAASCGAAWANEPAVTEAAPVVVAQASAATSTAVGQEAIAFPADQAGVRAAAAQGPDALRRYVYRTRMIYNFYYRDFAPKE